MKIENNSIVDEADRNTKKVKIRAQEQRSKPVRCVFFRSESIDVRIVLVG